MREDRIEAPAAYQPFRSLIHSSLASSYVGGVHTPKHQGYTDDPETTSTFCERRNKEKERP